MDIKNIDTLSIARRTFDMEIEELKKVRDRLDEQLEKVADMIIETKGKVVITGIGKSGLIGKKIAATLASTGTQTVFVNSAEGLHGDLGVISKEDVVIGISNSGSSDEILSLLPSIEKIGAKLVAMTGNRDSLLAKKSQYVLDIGVSKEACPLNLAPMSSTTVTLVMGDALASILIEKRGFRAENFAVYHPGGALGRRLLLKIKDIMKKGSSLAYCTQDSKMEEIILKMTEKKLGAVCVMEDDVMIGIITEGDIRRALTRKEEFFRMKADDIMTKNYTKTTPESMAIDALELMENRESQISILPVIDDDNRLVGMVRTHDILKLVGR